MSEENITLEKALDLIPESEYVHTFLNPNGMLIGADWSRELVIEKIKKHGVQLSGEQATRMHHGLVIYDGTKYIFIET